MSYPRSGLALDQVSLKVGKGEFCFMTGHSGAGKSTLLRLLHMAEQPTEGEVRVAGYTSSRIKPREIAILRRKIGFVFQDFRLLPDRTAADNVAFALKVTGARRSVIQNKVGRLLAQVGLSGRAQAFATELSAGEQQRVAIARALANGPIMLLADEPTGNLDERSTRGVFQLLKDINAAGTAIILATHDLELVRASPKFRVVELDHGRVVYDSQTKCAT